MKKLTLILLFLPFILSAQKLDIFLGTDIPLQFKVGASGFILKSKLKIDFSTGKLTNPYDKTIINIIKKTGADEKYVRLLENSFNEGLFMDFGANFMFNNKNYLGIFAQNIDLDAATTPVSLIGSYTGVISIDPTTGTSPKLAMKTNMFQIGIKYGHSYNLFKERAFLRLEFGIGKNIRSNTIILANGEKNKKMSDDINAEIEPVIKKYGYTPSINILFVFRLIDK